MVDKVLEGTWAEGMLIGIPALTIVITVMVRIGIRVVGKVKQVRTMEGDISPIAVSLLGHRPTYPWICKLLGHGIFELSQQNESSKSV